MSVMENWLTDENFDFEVTSSPVLLNETSTSKGDKGEDDDEEVFFGPQTHKERCIATVVKEQEQLRTPCELKPEEQALLLREAALVGLRIKHGSASKHSRSSPVAIVYPMKRDDFSVKEVTQKSIAGPDLNKQESKPSKILQPKTINSIRRQSYSVGNNKTKLPMARNRGQSNVEAVEQLVDQASLYGLTGDTLSDDNKENIKKPTARRKSGIPNKKDNNPLRKTTSASNVPSLLPSALPSTATIATKIKNPNHLVNKESKLKPMKGISQSKVKALPQSQLRLPASRQSLASQGTPSKSVKARQSGIASLKRESSFTSKTAGTPGLKNTSKDQEEHKLEIPAARNALVTPIQRTPSSRKSIVGRQILARSASNSTINNATMETQSRKLNEDEKTGINDQQVHTPKTEIKEQQMQAPKTEIKEQQVQAPKTDIKEQQVQAPKTETNDQIQAPNLSHSNIMSRYRKLCEKASKSEVELEKKLPLTPLDSCINSEAVETKTGVEVLGVFKESLEKNKTELPQLGMSEFAVPVSVISDTIKQPEESAPLIEILPEEQKPASLLHLSPVRCFNQFLDPFHTGETPPPLIDIGDVLEPEKSKELNLIEF